MPHNTHTKKPNNIQTEICKRYEVLPLAPEEKVAVALNSLNDNPIYGTRIELPEAGTISWFFYCGEFSDSDDFYQVIHTSHLDKALPEVVNYLYLPEGSRFIIDRSGYEDIWFE
ncbi:immunity protein Imm33 domain-containing protein [Proteus hauseri]|uniref:immunity protein Imm33 domain-containing protein n=1 Tax=Proteus hauseri TaxID=183417 RepID=UPI0032DA8195